MACADHSFHLAGRDGDQPVEHRPGSPRSCRSRSSATTRAAHDESAQSRPPPRAAVTTRALRSRSARAAPASSARGRISGTREGSASNPAALVMDGKGEVGPPQVRHRTPWPEPTSGFSAPTRSGPVRRLRDPQVAFGLCALLDELSRHFRRVEPTAQPPKSTMSDESTGSVGLLTRSISTSREVCRRFWHPQADRPLSERPRASLASHTTQPPSALDHRPPSPPSSP